MLDLVNCFLFLFFCHTAHTRISNDAYIVQRLSSSQSGFKAGFGVNAKVCIRVVGYFVNRAALVRTTERASRDTTRTFGSLSAVSACSQRQLAFLFYFLLPWFASSSVAFGISAPLFPLLYSITDRSLWNVAVMDHDDPRLHIFGFIIGHNPALSTAQCRTTRPTMLSDSRNRSTSVLLYCTVQ